tara:strand:+ start:20315 stop:20536 length:222 start_codon:yes stop_codon:yes gene_type:complete
MTQEDIQELDRLLSLLGNMTMDHINSSNENCINQVRHLMKKVNVKPRLGNIERNFLEDEIDDYFNELKGDYEI